MHPAQAHVRGSPRPRESWVVVAALAAAACQVQRELQITSQPPGAEVRVDGEAVGRTPVQVPYLHYGTRRVTFYLDGYLTQSQVVEIQPRWFNVFPLDLITEVLAPVGWSDLRAIHAELEHGSGAISLPALEGVLERAEILRRSGPEGPLSEQPTQPKPASVTTGG
jgi:hypothetical protein